MQEPFTRIYGTFDKLMSKSNDGIIFCSFGLMVNKIDRPGHLPFIFQSFCRSFCRPLSLFSHCVIRRKLEPLDRAPEAEQWHIQHATHSTDLRVKS